MSQTSAALLDQSIEILDRLIAFATVSKDSNLDLIDYCRQLAEPYASSIQTSYDADKKKANLFITIGPDIDGGVVLTGHTDVVPVDGQPWSSDPFKMTKKQDRLYGRGSCDMKGFIACALAMMPVYASLDLKKPIHIALSYDEEVGCLGALEMMKALKQSGRHPEIAIIGEPTNMSIVYGHKGCCNFTTTLTGLESHSSLPDNGVSAIEYGAQFLNCLYEIKQELKQLAPNDSPFIPPYSSLHCGKIKGGNATNTIARECVIEWQIRPIQDSDIDYTKAKTTQCNQHLLKQMQSAYQHASIETVQNSALKGLEPLPESEAISLVQQLTKSTERGVVSFGTEAGIFKQAGMSAVVCGPGSIEQAHKPDEYIEITQMSACLAMLDSLIEKVI